VRLVDKGQNALMQCGEGDMCKLQQWHGTTHGALHTRHNEVDARHVFGPVHKRVWWGTAGPTQTHLPTSKLECSGHGARAQNMHSSRCQPCCTATRQNPSNCSCPTCHSCLVTHPGGGSWMAAPCCAVAGPQCVVAGSCPPPPPPTPHMTSPMLSVC
jgi:hypothetical protein